MNLHEISVSTHIFTLFRFISNHNHPSLPKAIRRAHWEIYRSYSVPRCHSHSTPKLRESLVACINKRVRRCDNHISDTAESQYRITYLFHYFRTIPRFILSLKFSSPQPIISGGRAQGRIPDRLFCTKFTSISSTIIQPTFISPGHAALFLAHNSLTHPYNAAHPEIKCPMPHSRTI